MAAPVRALRYLAILAGVAGAMAAIACPDFARAAQSDQDRAREELLEGRILDYDEILRRARAAVPGRVVGQELLRDREGRFVYRLKIIRPDGKVVAALLDARTGRVLSVNGSRR